MFTSREVSIDNLMNEMQPVVLENKRFSSKAKSKTFAIFSSLKFPTQEAFPKILWLNDALQLQSSCLGPRYEKFSGSFSKTRNSISRHFPWICNNWHFPPIKISLQGTKRNNWNSRTFLKVKKRRLVFEKGRCVFPGKIRPIPTFRYIGI